MAVVSLDSPSCEVPCLILHSMVYRDVTRQAKGLHRLKYVGALESGLVYLSRCNSGWFCHRLLVEKEVEGDKLWVHTLREFQKVQHSEERVFLLCRTVEYLW
jgi:hypothetical protein